MGTKLLNEYCVYFADNHTEVFMAENMAAVTKIKETPSLALSQITRVRVGVGVETPIRPVKFNVVVSPDAAKDNGCYATPETWIVPEDTKVIFTAIPAQGFEFVGWFREDETTAFSTEPVVECAVEYPADPDALVALFTAKFAPIGP